MFEYQLEQATATIHVDNREKEVLDMNGHFELNSGFNVLTYHKAVGLIDHYYKVRPSVSKYQIKRFDGIFKSIMFSFGPEFLERHGQ